MTPGPELEWIDGGTEPREVSWKIIAREIAKPEVVGGLVFQADVNQIGVTVDDDSAKYFTFSAVSVTNAVNADVYTYAVSLNDKVNTIWKGGGTDDITGTWTISPAKVTRPTPTALEFTYDGTEKSVFDSSSLPELDTRYRLDSGDIKATEGGSYSFKFTLIGNDEATNYVWADSETDEPYEATWTIKPAANAITKFEVRGWKIGLAPNDPILEATYGAETAKVTYGFGSNASTITTWLDDPRDIDKSGTWTARAVILPKESWAGAEKTVTFDMWDDPADLYHDCVEISVKGTGTDVEEIPVPVRISSERMTGFSYDRVGSDGTGFLFVDEIGNILPYEVDTWDTSGESLVWLKLKSLPAAGISVTMYWNLISGKIAPADAVYSPTKVWSDYVGVWHLSETAAGAVVVKDASGHKDGTGHARSIVTNGLFCAARGRNEEKVNGPTMTVPRYNEMDALVNGSFTVSGWLMSTLDTPYYSYIFSRKSADNTPAWGAQWRGGGGNADMLAIYSSGNADNDNNRNVFNTQNVFLKNKWVKYDVVYEPTTVSLYIDGALVGTQAIKPTGGAKSGTLPFAVGGFTGDANNSTVHGFSDEVRLRSSAASAEWIAAEYTALSDSDLTSAGHVYHDGLKANKWIVYPELDKTEWDVNGEKGTFISEGETLYGEVTHVIYSVYDTTKTFDSPADITEPGLYRIDFTTTEIEDTETLEYTIDINVIESQPYIDIGGGGGDSGRVLLMNNHIGEDGHPDIDYQGWYDADNAGAKKSDTPTYWHHENLDAPGVATFNLKNGTESMLYAVDGRRLWHIVNCRHGNTFPTKTADALIVNQNYLPYTPTYSKTITGHRANQAATTRSTVGQLVMQNTEDAVVYSSCFTNGIGTIYFDAVNGWCRSTENYENYKIVVEYATNTVYGTAPTDVNSMTVVTEYDDDDNPVVTTNLYGNITAAEWQPAAMIPFLMDGTADFVRQDATNELALAVKTGGTMNNFYRIVVPLDIAGPVRFRIRRTSYNQSGMIDAVSLILLDNIIASVPADRADLVSAGHFDAEKAGRQILGWELATSVPYPSKDDTGITGAAVPKYEVHSGDPETVDTSKFVASATMHYRWRYLNQDIGEWKSVDLNPSDGFRALSAFELPGRAGDVEYWFDYRLQAPFYSYVDYSGSGKAIDYTEERGTLTNRLDSAETLASGGRDWFFRLRDGRSKYAALDIVYKRAGSSVVEREHMALDGDGLWRGFVQTKENQTGLLTYRIEAMDYCDNYWHCKLDNPEFPVSDSLEEGTAESWSKITLDAVTGHVMFQIDDRTNPKSITIVHADYQNFNGWSDAHDRKASNGNGHLHDERVQGGRVAVEADVQGGLLRLADDAGDERVLEGADVQRHQPPLRARRVRDVPERHELPLGDRPGNVGVGEVQERQGQLGSGDPDGGQRQGLPAVHRLLRRAARNRVRLVQRPPRAVHPLRGLRLLLRRRHHEPLQLHVHGPRHVRPREERRLRRQRVPLARRELPPEQGLLRGLLGVHRQGPCEAAGQQQGTEACALPLERLRGRKEDEDAYRRLDQHGVQHSGGFRKSRDVHAGDAVLHLGLQRGGQHMGHSRRKAYGRNARHGEDARLLERQRLLGRHSIPRPHLEPSQEGVLRRPFRKLRRRFRASAVFAVGSHAEQGHRSGYGCEPRQHRAGEIQDIRKAEVAASRS